MNEKRFKSQTIKKNWRLRDSRSFLKRKQQKKVSILFLDVLNVKKTLENLLKKIVISTFLENLKIPLIFFVFFFLFCCYENSKTLIRILPENILNVN